MSRVYHRPGWTCECGCPNGAWRTTCFRCDEPKPAPQPNRDTTVCGRRVVRGGYRAHCFMEANHSGACR